MPSPQRLKTFGMFSEARCRSVGQGHSRRLGGNGRDIVLSSRLRAICARLDRLSGDNGLEEQLAEAELAASKGDQGAIYRVVNSLAPKRRRDQVRIRSTQGHLLSVRQEFEEIFAYFSKAFARQDEFQPPQITTQLAFSE